MRMANRSDVGRIRMVNEDSAAVVPDCQGYSLAIVADGMGGHKAGDIASQMAIEKMQEYLVRSLRPGASSEECGEWIKQAVYEANRSIFEAASRTVEYSGMGTTAIVTLADRNRLILGHIGDSRAYLLSNGQLRQLTEDHSLVNMLIKSGQITPEEAEQHPRRNILTRALGTDEEVDVDIIQAAWAEGDVVLVCTDGLSGAVPKEELRLVLNSEGDLDEKANQLVNKALEAGGDDNITVVLMANESNHSEGAR
ncbi:Stp1/IreP family PP2C-type Ser/Thr phosphatase [Paenibacillus sp. J2TS4]|uniref:Stp1/IreP family PP2C-type Ser/Thr phosphatase n=1 Tax=Paenibacillus sp. J2TS4 TaxID=2807194 RepID=UPI001B286307|nr:Stp1/IreP family PP2C-type Ser/Thr phosphatase [Paenibacillus sp. J2TS4]GIP32955.1 protein phosphatase [Paenibacillus sp. J2TS4]